MAAASPFRACSEGHRSGPPCAHITQISTCPPNRLAATSMIAETIFFTVEMRRICMRFYRDHEQGRPRGRARAFPRKRQRARAPAIQKMPDMCCQHVPGVRASIAQSGGYARVWHPRSRLTTANCLLDWPQAGVMVRGVAPATGLCRAAACRPRRLVLRPVQGTAGTRAPDWRRHRGAGPGIDFVGERCWRCLGLRCPRTIVSKAREGASGFAGRTESASRFTCGFPPSSSS